MATKIRIEFNTSDANVKIQTVTIPWECRIVWSHDERGKLRFAFEVNGGLYRPQLKDIRRIQTTYCVKSYRCVAEYMRGETLMCVHTTY